MKLNGKLDYLELPATGATLDSVKAFYSAAFSWSFTDYGPTYSAFGEGLDGGFQADAGEAPAKPLPVLYSQDLEATLDVVESAGGTIVKPYSRSRAAGGSISPIPLATSWRSGANSASPRQAVDQFCTVANSALSFRAARPIRPRAAGKARLLGRRQVVRHRFLVPTFPGSNPGAPAKSHAFGINDLPTLSMAAVRSYLTPTRPRLR